ncbi:MAG: M48 family metallopeptidase [Chlorobi bacterium]|nr:M48 family metallopeptidase [Chlorobiota bacterium]
MSGLARLCETADDRRRKALQLGTGARCRHGGAQRGVKPSVPPDLRFRIRQPQVCRIFFEFPGNVPEILYHHHGKEFCRMLDRMMPDWRKRKERLEKVMA